MLESEDLLKLVEAEMHKNMLLLLFALFEIASTPFFKKITSFNNSIHIRLSEKCLSFTGTSFTTMHLYTDMKHVMIFILIIQNGSYVIR